MVKLIIKHDDIASTCFICKGELNPIDMSYEDGICTDTYSCDHCNIMIDFITPDSVHEYTGLDRIRIEVYSAT